MNEREIITQVEKREAAVQLLRDAVAACWEAELTRDDILEVLRPQLFTGDDGILVEGPLLEQLSDAEASSIIRTIHGALSEGATLSFVAGRRSPAQVYALCHEADIGRANVTITAEGQSLRVAIAKLQS
ncbi:MAG: hypothetical protein ACXW31_13120 [Thermoanaerobaculia bacterium]